ncbi:MAG: hypothetical protein HY678_10055 [Chloroflexi bacterium]|nr:hypothetical protein [Chloroflexota bacterium]
MIRSAIASVLVFGIGLVAIAAAWAVAWLWPAGDAGGWAVRLLMVPVALSLALMTLKSVHTKDRERWLHLLGVSILFLVFSAFAFLSLGGFVLPFALVLLVISVMKLFYLRRLSPAPSDSRIDIK